MIIGEENLDHAWILSGYGQSMGEVNAKWRLRVEALDENRTLLSVNSSADSSMTTSWNQQTMRFRPHENATNFQISLFPIVCNIFIFPFFFLFVGSSTTITKPCDRISSAYTNTRRYYFLIH